MSEKDVRETAQKLWATLTGVRHMGDGDVFDMHDYVNKEHGGAVAAKWWELGIALGKIPAPPK